MTRSLWDILLEKLILGRHSDMDISDGLTLLHGGDW